MMREMLHSHWWPWIGRPRIMRADQGGGYAGKEIQEWLSEQGIKVDLVPRDAHWQLSYPERTIGILKDMLDAMARAPDSANSVPGQPVSTGVGLANIRNRLAQSYGRNHLFETRSQPTQSDCHRVRSKP